MILLPLTISLASLESPYRPMPAVASETRAKSPCATGAGLTVKTGKQAASDTQGIAGLPFAMGRKFATLDAYLAHLECTAAPIDKPWWKQVRPGVYMRMTTATNAPPNEVATRAELMKRFGFSR